MSLVDDEDAVEEFAEDGAASVRRWRWPRCPQGVLMIWMLMAVRTGVEAGGNLASRSRMRKRNRRWRRRGPCEVAGQWVCHAPVGAR